MGSGMSKDAHKKKKPALRGFVDKLLLFVLLRCHPCLFFLSFFSSFLSINGMLIYADKLKPKSTSLDKLTCWSISAIPPCVFPHINTSYLFLSYYLRRPINNLCVGSFTCCRVCMWLY